LRRGFLHFGRGFRVGACPLLAIARRVLGRCLAALSAVGLVPRPAGATGATPANKKSFDQVRSKLSSFRKLIILKEAQLGAFL